MEQSTIQACERIHERARYIRGRFLNSVAVIERKIALILTDYFCTSDEGKRELFFTEIVNGHFFPLNSKKGILLKIIQMDYPRYWKENKITLKALDDIQKFRNKLAHSVVDVSEDALKRPLDEGVGFIEWNDGKPITERDFEQWERRINMSPISI